MSLGVVKECARLLEFREFLQSLTIENNATSSTTADGNELRNCMTRTNNETYPLSADELNAEIIMTVWTHLQKKNCPLHFQQQILRKATQIAEAECFASKKCDLTYITRYSVMVDENEQQAQEKYYDLIKLQKFVINILERLLTRLNDNIEAANLKNYAAAGTLCSGDNCNCVTQKQSTLAPTYVAAAVKNKPRKMEDRYVCLPRYSEMYQLPQSYSFYGVYDGHSGPLAASYAATQLPMVLAERLLAFKCKNLTTDDYREALEYAYLHVDEMYIKKRISSGTTAVSILIAKQEHRDHLYVAWVGDSKALLVGPKANLQLVKSHKPDSPEEKQRIESSEAGGTVMFVQGHWRINGILNVSRSIGDYSVSAAIAEPDFVDVELHDSHDFLVLGTDGLFDHVAESQIVQTVYDALCCKDQKLDDIPKLLIDLAKQADSQDNITVVIVFLKTIAQIVEHYKSQ